MAAVLQADDIAAIDRYITSSELRTPAAQAARDAWIRWIDGTTYLDRNFDRATLDHARNARLAFDLANATTDAERAAIIDKATTGVSLEEIEGGADRRDSSGRYSEIAPASLSTRVVLYVLGALGLVGLAKRTLLK